jgi:tetratricopeptide (TPR) repeat protein
LDPQDYLAKYFVAMMKYGNPKTAAENVQIAQALKEVRSLNPSFAPAHVELSYAYLRAGQLDQALRAAQYAAHLEPGRAGYQANVARILLLQGDAKGAAELARLIADRWNGTDRDQAIEIWKEAVAKDKSAATPALELTSDAPPGAEFNGTIVSAQCGDSEKKQASEIVVRNGEKVVHLRGDVEKPMRIGFEDTLWYGDHFSYCRHVEGRAVDAIYIPSGENEGTIVQIRVEDELPPALTGGNAQKAAGQ